MSALRVADGRRLVLASGSPRRREMLAGLGLDFERRPVNIDETPWPGETPENYVLRLAREKATAAGPVDGEAILAGDTIVMLDGEILGKPDDTEEACRMLRALSGRDHEVVGGWAVLADGKVTDGLDRTRVWFEPVPEAFIAAYVASGEPMDKAGAYAIQGQAGAFIRRINGSYANVIGWPLDRIIAALLERRIVAFSAR